MLKSLLNHGAQRHPCLAYRGQTIPFLEWPDVHAGGEEETDGVCDELPVGVRIVAQESRLSAFLNVMKEDFGGVSSQVGAAKHCFIISSMAGVGCP